ncbi:hypothetical protein GCM10028797_20610 [Dyella agri]
MRNSSRPPGYSTVDSGNSGNSAREERPAMQQSVAGDGWTLPTYGIVTMSLRLADRLQTL